MTVRIIELLDVGASDLRCHQTLVQQHSSPRLGSRTQGGDVFNIRPSGLLRWMLTDFSIKEPSEFIL